MRASDILCSQDRAILVYDARAKIANNARKNEHKVRQMHNSYTNAKINQYKHINSAIRNKHK